MGFPPDPTKSIDGDEPGPAGAALRARTFGSPPQPEVPDERRGSDDPDHPEPVRRYAEAEAEEPTGPRRSGSSQWRRPFLYAVILVVAAVIGSAAVAPHPGHPPGTARPGATAAGNPPADIPFAPVGHAGSATPPDSPSPSESLSHPAPPVPSTTTPRPLQAKPSATKPPKVVRATIIASTGACVDVKGANTADGTGIQTYRCHGSIGQEWVTEADSTLRSVGKCMRIDGTKIVLWTCDSTAAEVWRAGAGSTLVNPATCRCLDGNAGGADHFLHLAPCDGSADQRWQVTPK